jgi:superfamily I DNA/RNA helicase
MTNHATATRWDDGLDGVFRRIAEVNHTPLRVLAGPGTGKTFALIRRVARMLYEEEDPDRILVCTFTRTAARDLQTELSRLQLTGANSVHAGTIHSLCFSFLSQADILQYTRRNPRPLLNFEERFLLEDLEGDQFGGIRERENRLDAFNAAWARLQTDDPGWPTDPVDRQFHVALLRWLQFHQAMLIGELVPETLRYLRDNPASPFRDLFLHVLVDEYQDLNRAEQVLLDVFSENGTLTVVGDEDQSIYAFKFAHPEGIALFDQYHLGTHDEDLTECQRSPHRVIEMANCLISNNTRQGRVLIACAGNPQGEVSIVQWPTMEAEALGIAQFIQEKISAGEVEPGRVLVLAPRRQLGYAVRDALNSLGVFAHSFFHEQALDGYPKKLDACAAQQAFTILTLLAIPEDRVALRVWCGFGSPSLRRGAWSRLRLYCEEVGDSPRLVLERLSDGEIIVSRTNDLIDRFRELQTMVAEHKDLVGQALVDSLFPEDKEWARPFRSIASYIEGDDFDAMTLREALRVGVTQPELPTDVNYVRVMSLHKSKGLTADLVAVVGCIEGLIPTIPSDTTPVEQERSLEEQRRLFYVAITRTRRILILSSVTQIPRKVAHRLGVEFSGATRTHVQTIASRFLAELGPARPIPEVGNSILRRPLP